MALQPFSLNSITSPYPCTYPSFPSLYLLLLQPQTHSSTIPRSLRLRISCSNQTSQVDKRQQPQRIKVAFETTKKKRKPKPSFFEQIKDKWSLKPSSKREKFPWEEPEEEHEDKERQKSSGLCVSDSGIEAKESVSDPVSSVFPNRGVLPPWVHGSKSNTRNLRVHSEPETSTQKSCELREDFDEVGGHYKNGTESAFVERVERMEIHEQEVDFNVMFEREGEAFDEIPSGGLENEETKISSGINGVFLNKRPSGKGEHFETNVGSVDGRRGSIGLPGKREGDVLDEIPIGVLKDEETKIYSGINGVPLNENPRDEHFGKNVGFVEGSSGSMGLPWKRGKVMESGEGDKRSNTELAERKLPEHELRRLRNVALRMLERTKVGVAGITQALVDSIHEKWRSDEVVKLKFEGPLAINMKRTHDILERKTGGLVIWRSGSSVVLYRGITYKLPCVESYAKQSQTNMNMLEDSKGALSDTTHNIVVDTIKSTEPFIPDSAKYLKDLSKEELMELSDLNHLLDELGPRFTDWTGREPFPVDADLLPVVVPGYKPPFRLLPFGARHCLRNKEMTIIRRLARTMPPHFALGRSRELQGLARAMVKLWERSAIAKVAIKRGVLNTRNERMAEELKKLTGGTLVSRNKDYIVFYRGNDYLPPVVTKVLKERKKLTDLQQNVEEQAREMASASIVAKAKASKVPLVAGTLAETIAATSRWGNQPSSEDVQKMIKDSALTRHALLVKYLQNKLSIAKGRLKRAENALAKVQEYLEPADIPTDLETITDEERLLFRKMGLRMKPYLHLGRRGVYAGVIENMHLHWKYRELVKIIVRGKRLEQVKHIAISLEAESGGVLVSLDKTNKGYAIIVYRGKNYRQPQALRPKNLLTRRQALARSIELQRREALKHHISDLQERMELVKSELEDLRNGKEIDDSKTLYSRLDDHNVSDDDIEEDKGEEAYLETYDIGSEDSHDQNMELRPV
nr:CRM-domain containing factor CFM3, chloroplastic/mitochondrial [Quercus suber]POF11370.1 crm-domain containing factor cfm3, chloroplastic/mitochondrial [Quercus suber]